MLPACDLQAAMPENLQLPADRCLLQAHVLQRRAELRSPVRRSHVVRCACGLRSGCGSRVCRSGSRDVCGSRRVRSGSSGVRCSGRVRSGSGVVRRSVRSGSGQVLRQRMPEELLQCRSVRSGALDL